MPVDSSVSQELRVVARQIGGRSLHVRFAALETLFPLDHLRVDGRVLWASSAQYLLLPRLNSAKELIAVRLVRPFSDADMDGGSEESSFLHYTKSGVITITITITIPIFFSSLRRCHF